MGEDDRLSRMGEDDHYRGNFSVNDREKYLLFRSTNANISCLFTSAYNRYRTHSPTGAKVEKTPEPYADEHGQDGSRIARSAKIAKYRRKWKTQNFETRKMEITRLGRRGQIKFENDCRGTAWVAALIQYVRL